MKNPNKLVYIVVAAFLLSFMISCEESDSEKEYGFTLIYMPQTTVFSGGADNNYPVPSGDTLNPNYIVNGSNIDIVLGVYRAGLQSLNEFTVDIYADVDTASMIVNDNLIENAAVLPADTYTFPASVAVPDGTRETTFFLTVDGAKLASNYSELAGKKLIVAIGLKNPSKYELNESLAKTIVVIDSNSFMSTP